MKIFQLKITSKLVVFIIAILALAANDLAQTQAEQLTQMVVRLKEAPTDNALREKIMKFAAAMKPAPVVSDTAIEFEGRAQFAFKKAQNEAEFVNAAAEYEKAVAAPPWVAGYYSDLCTIYEKAGRYTEAKQNCGYYLVSLTDPDQITDTKRRIAGLDYGIEQNAVRKAEQEKLARAEDERRRAEQAKRDVITRIKDIVNNRMYEVKEVSYSSTNPFGGVSLNELFGGGLIYIYDAGCPVNWKFFDHHVELRMHVGYRCDEEYLQVVGESSGPDITDMRWYTPVTKHASGLSKYSDSDAVRRTWGYFEPGVGLLFIDISGLMPLNDSGLDRNKRYRIYRYKPLCVRCMLQYNVAGKVSDDGRILTILETLAPFAADRSDANCRAKNRSESQFTEEYHNENWWRFTLGDGLVFNSLREVIK